MKNTGFLMTVVAAVLMATACQKKEIVKPDTPKNLSQEELDALFMGDQNGDYSYKARPRPEGWADCEGFAGVVAPATFNPSAGNFDEMYLGGNGFKDGKVLISESKPGDQDYNGGRWHRNELKAGVDPDKYSEACSVDDLDLNDFMSTDIYFECPLLPRRGM